MLFNSFEFALFLPIVFLLYWFVFSKSLKVQNFFILVVSYVFYGWWDWRFLSLIAFSSAVDYLCALKIQDSSKEQNRKLFLWISMAINLGFLGVFKYFNFFTESFADLLKVIGFNVNPYTLNFILPVGISFYTFQTMSYTIDVYRKQLNASNDIVSFFAYVSFFPQLVAGPIERAINLLPQFNVKRKFSYKVGSDGMMLILWGLFKKIVIADNCAVYVNYAFENYETASGIELILGAVFFAFQIYGDFSGYSDIALGCAKLLGFELMVNFKTPYFSRDMAEFWRRWHISLSTWFRDYLYIPLGGSKGRKSIAIRNTIIIFLVSGFWHGANWTFIVWGALNALYFLPLLLFRKNRENLNVAAENSCFPSIKEFFQILLTFSLTCLSWIYFRSIDVNNANNYIISIFENQFFEKKLFSIEYFILFMLILFFLMIEWANRLNGFNFTIYKIKYRILKIAFLIFIALQIFLFGLFEKVNFIYFQF